MSRLESSSSASIYHPFGEDSRGKGEVQNAQHVDVSSLLKDTTLPDYVSYEKALAGWTIEDATKVSRQKEDENTPDFWVERSPALIRLTGAHPMNAEPGVILLLNAGLITPSPIHYVRSHGLVPKCEKESDYELVIDGLIPKTCTFTLETLKSLPPLEFPVTFACDGNRRKEINQIKHSLGFNWGPGVVSTAVWKGVPLHSLLRSCGIDESNASDLYVCFEGTEILAKGPYGTSIPLSYILDPMNDAILAYEMNGSPLPPDHGYPLRVILPGFVGGRMIKWLKKITISDKESTSFYHWGDNKVLPSHIDTIAAAESWWSKPEYTIYEMNVNSIIASPGHEYLVKVETIDDKDTIEIRGYAYSGGGRPIVRVELSTDGGKTWQLTKLSFLPNKFRHGWKCWTWCHWSFDLPKWKLLLMHGHELIVRAWDRSMQTQPEKPTWNILGQMNNSWYRVLIEVSDTKSVRFIHPVQPGKMSGGWLKSDERATPKGQMLNVETTQGFRPIPYEEVQKHNTIDDCWCIIDGRVYDFTPYLSRHPGGAHAIVAVAGKNASSFFHDVHAVEIERQKEMFCIGTITQPLPTSQRDTEKHLVALDCHKWVTALVTNKKQVSSDTIVLQFKFPKKPATGSKIKYKTKVGLPTGQHILIGAQIEHEFVVRPYTPILPATWEEDKGTVDVLLKVYGPRGTYPAGKLSSYMNTLKVGDNVQMRGPNGAVLYHGNGQFTVRGKTFFANQVSFLSGGSGITPVYQVARAILGNKNDKVRMALIDANNTYEDILLREEFEKLAEDSRFHVWHTLSRNPPENHEWKYSTGHVTEQMIREHLFGPGPTSVVFVCGPPAMIEKACYPVLEKLGYVLDENVFEF